MNNDVTALAHNQIVDSLEETRDNERATVDERYMASLLLDILIVAGDHPGVVDLINKRTLRAFEKKDERGYRRD